MLTLNRAFFLKVTPPVIALSALIISIYWYGAAPTKNLVTAKSLSSSPDYFITKLSVKEFDSDGVLIETLNAKQTLHYISKSITLLENPHVSRHTKSANWSAKADKGVIEDGSSDILLTENAKAVKQYLSSDEITLIADSVHYLDKDTSLTSSGNATLLSTQGKTSANTITTFINSEEVIMTGSVRGKYETAH